MQAIFIFRHSQSVQSGTKTYVTDRTGTVVVIGRSGLSTISQFISLFSRSHIHDSLGHFRLFSHVPASICYFKLTQHLFLKVHRNCVASDWLITGMKLIADTWKNVSKLRQVLNNSLGFRFIFMFNLRSLLMLICEKTDTF